MAHFKLFIFENIFSKIEKIVNIFLILEKIFLKINNLELTWYICSKIKNCCLKIFLKIRVDEKMYQNKCNVV